MTDKRRPRFRSTRRTWLAAILLVLCVTGGALAGTLNPGEPTADVPATATPSAPPPGASANPTPTVGPGPGPSAGASADPVTETDTTALALLASIPVKGKAPKTGYERTGMFGTAWLDVDRNGCDTRNDILARDLTTLTKSGNCRVMTGNLVSPFTAAPVVFVRGQDTSALVQIDHVVALSNAWQTGAQQLSQAERIALANDPINLLAVDGASNAQKGDGDAATWLPPNKAFRCTYVARQVSVKATYGLWVTPAEHDAMSRVLSSCPGERALSSPLAPAPAAGDTRAGDR